jgi:hypothetical protein
MTEGHGAGYGEEGSAQRPSGRGAVTERLAGGQGGASILDPGQRAREEQLAPTGYEPPLADPDQPGPRGQTVVTEPGEPRTDPGHADPGPPPVADSPAGPPGSLLPSLDAAALRSRFLDIQAGFVDEPRQAVQEAGRFVDDLVRQVVDALHGQRGQLEATGAEGSTEDLRLTLRAYRRLVDRLLGLAD